MQHAETVCSRQGLGLMESNCALAIIDYTDAELDWIDLGYIEFFLSSSRDEYCKNLLENPKSRIFRSIHKLGRVQLAEESPFFRLRANLPYKLPS